MFVLEQIICLLLIVLFNSTQLIQLTILYNYFKRYNFFKQTFIHFILLLFFVSHQTIKTW